jgi:hypothetical protein
MPLSKAGKKIKAKLEKQYGEKKGEGIFYAMENKGEIPGMNKMKGYAKGGDTKAKKKKNLANRLRREFGNSRENVFDRLERASAVRARQYNKGGMVKSTGKMNTGIRKCGE